MFVLKTILKKSMLITAVDATDSKFSIGSATLLRILLNSCGWLYTVSAYRIKEQQNNKMFINISMKFLELLNNLKKKNSRWFNMK